MYPSLFNVEFLDMYTIMLIAGLLCAVLLFRFICSKKKVDDSTYNFYAITAVVAIALGLVFAVLFQSFYNFIDTGVFKLAGLTFMGGLIGGAATFIVSTVIFAKPPVKRSFWKIANYAAPCIVAGHMLGRLGCFFAGCCHGKVTDSFLGVQFPGTNQKVYPTQLFEVIFLAVLLTVMLLLLFKFKKDNFLIILYGIAYAVFRFLIEFLRGDKRGNFLPVLSPSQWQSIVLLLISITLALLVYKFKIIPFAKAKDKPPTNNQQTENPTTQNPTTPIDNPPTETTQQPPTNITTTITDNPADVTTETTQTETNKDSEK